MNYQRIIFRVLGARKYIFLGVGILCLAVAVGLTALLWPESQPAKAPDIQKQSANETALFVASEEFNKLDIQTRQDYMEKVLADTSQHADLWAARKLMNEKQRKQIGENMKPVFRKMIETRIDHYFTLPADQREPYLDELIDQALALRDNFKKITKNDPPDENDKRHEKNRHAKGRRGGPPIGNDKGFQKFIASTTPQERSKMMRFGFAAIKRLKERGLMPKPK